MPYLVCTGVTDPGYKSSPVVAGRCWLNVSC